MKKQTQKNKLIHKSKTKKITQTGGDKADEYKINNKTLLCTYCNSNKFIKTHTKLDTSSNLKKFLIWDFARTAFTSTIRVFTCNTCGFIIMFRKKDDFVKPKKREEIEKKT